MPRSDSPATSGNKNPVANAPPNSGTTTPQRGNRARSAGRGKDRGTTQDPKRTANQKKTELTSLKARIGKLAALLRTYLQTSLFSDQSAKEEAISWLDSMAKALPTSPVLSKSDIEKLLSDKAAFEAEKAALCERKPRALDWKDQNLLAKWIHARGPQRTVIALKAMLAYQKQLEQGLGIRSIAKTQASSSSGKQTPQQQNRYQQSAPVQTPTKQQIQTSNNVEPAFAWSVFQNSPDPKSLPRPSRLSKFKKEENSAALSKLGVPFPPPHVASKAKRLPAPPSAPPPTRWLTHA
mmetsp:Transcript_13650/g.26369  ORF Transcript_13650/g.26369 Transcript_13650/m.26369 type:complete len:294 (+) Transcript_13650:344-1225(+)|eukprot:CAMPEP_0171498130 /NCGR_PEP_ID=MMETSP0958-20121227/7674_1 /TAXON_ID=87120 /ORGANISM="Aurantiochytrium limacinum, Strain ATCCMYA-1381" /LENGTH=293 /DNA_ID=CAMNT_0012032485 /DNA_START=214 /DNA_END=1095 /DNA_ORIENTATION=-